MPVDAYQGPFFFVTVELGHLPSGADVPDLNRSIGASGGKIQAREAISARRSFSDHGTSVLENFLFVSYLARGRVDEGVGEAEKYIQQLGDEVLAIRLAAAYAKFKDREVYEKYSAELLNRFEYSQDRIRRNSAAMAFLLKPQRNQDLLDKAVRMTRDVSQADEATRQYYSMA